MKLRGIEFGSVFNSSGARAFFSEGYWFHKYWRLLGLNYSGSTFVAKTTTFRPQVGNMPLDPKDGITPREKRPRCIVVKFRKGVVLNAVGLSGLGARALLETGRWQERTEPFLISFMAVSATPAERLLETQNFVDLLVRHQFQFRAPFGVQINFSCPNVGLNTSGLVEEARDALSAAASLRVPLIPKFNILVPGKAIRKIAEHPHCDAIEVSNTIPWGKLADRINWQGLFGSEASPLAHLGGGGLSGRPLLPLVMEWIQEARRWGLTKPIIGGGGILGPDDARQMINAGATAISLGSISILRPWRVAKTISAAHCQAEAAHKLVFRLS